MPRLPRGSCESGAPTGCCRSPRLSSILLAVEEHDNGWREVEAAPLVDGATGRVLDFIGAPDETRRSVWPRGVDRLAASPYAAALVAQHACTSTGATGTIPGWAPFFTEMETRRDRHLQKRRRSRSTTCCANTSFFASGT